MILSHSNQRNLLLAIAIAIAFALAPVVVSADDADAFDDEAPSVEVSDADIEAFAAALIDVQQIGQDWTQRMQEAEDQDEIAQMREDAREEMTVAIEEHGLSVQEYNEIATAAQGDPELAQRIQQAAGGF